MPKPRCSDQSLRLVCCNQLRTKAGGGRSRHPARTIQHVRASSVAGARTTMSLQNSTGRANSVPSCSRGADIAMARSEITVIASPTPALPKTRTDDTPPLAKTMTATASSSDGPSPDEIGRPTVRDVRLWLPINTRIIDIPSPKSKQTQPTDRILIQPIHDFLPMHPICPASAGRISSQTCQTKANQK